MSDSSQILCVKDVLENNEELAQKLVSALQDENIIERELSACTLGQPGYSRGSEFAKAVGDAQNGENIDPNGVALLLNSTVYYSGEINPEFKAICPACKQDWFRDISVVDFYTENLTQDQRQSYHNFTDVINNYDGRSSNLKCDSCGEENEVTHYDFQGMITFSNLALEFYNIDEFSDEFIAMVEDKLGVKTSIHHRLY